MQIRAHADEGMHTSPEQDIETRHDEDCSRLCFAMLQSAASSESPSWAGCGGAVHMCVAGLHVSQWSDQDSTLHAA